MWCWQGKTAVLRDKSAPVPLFPPQTPQELTWDRTPDSKMRGKRQTTLATARSAGTTWLDQTTKKCRWFCALKKANTTPYGRLLMWHMENAFLCSGNYKEHIRDKVSSCVRMDSACKDGRWLELVQDRVQWQALILSAFNLRVLLTENQLISNMHLK